MTTIRCKTAFVGVGCSEIARKSDRGITALALDAARTAIADAGLQREDIDGYVGAPLATNAGALHAEGGDEISAKSLAKALGLNKLSYTVDLFKAFPTDMAIVAAQALTTRDCNYVLGVRALYNPPGQSYSTGNAEYAYGDDQFRVPFGYSAGGARFATRARTYLEQAGASRRDLYAVVSLARRNAKFNPDAIWRDRDLSPDEYFASPMVSTPLCRFDCDIPVCGAAAFVMTRAENASLSPHPPVYLAGWAGWQQTDAIFERSRRRREDIDLCQLYDGFSSMIYEFLEELGWCEKYEAWRGFQDGRFERDGALPINTFGGSLGEGRLHGIGHVREAILQVGGRAGKRQLPKADNCLVQVGPYDSSSILVLSGSPQ